MSIEPYPLLKFLLRLLWFKAKTTITKLFLMLSHRKTCILPQNYVATVNGFRIFSRSKNLMLKMLIMAETA